MAMQFALHMSSSSRNDALSTTARHTVMIRTRGYGPAAPQHTQTRHTSVPSGGCLRTYRRCVHAMLLFGLFGLFGGRQGRV
jgi:hypothetical protein